MRWFITCSPASESSEPVGSSANTTRGPLTAARAIATRWACPPDSSPGRRSSRPSSPSRSNHDAAVSSAVARDLPLSSRGRAAFDRGQLGTSWPNWKTKPKAVRRRRLRSASPSVSMRSPSRRTRRHPGRDPGEAVEERGLARAARTHDRQDLPAFDRHVDAAQRLRLAEPLHETRRGQDGSGGRRRRRARPPRRHGRVGNGRRSGLQVRTWARSSSTRAVVISSQRRSARW